MKTAQPASLPPGVCGSGGISRSTRGSIVAASSGVKYTHGPGCTAVGGVPAFVAHGKLPLTTSARAEVAENTKVMAVVMSNSRRRTPGSERDEPGILSPALSAPGAILPIPLALSPISFATIVLPWVVNTEIPSGDASRQKHITV